MSIEFVDLAEQTIVLLEKLSAPVAQLLQAIASLFILPSIRGHGLEPPLSMAVKP